MQLSVGIFGFVLITFFENFFPQVLDAATGIPVFRLFNPVFGKLSQPVKQLPVFVLRQIVKQIIYRLLQGAFVIEFEVVSTLYAYFAGKRTYDLLKKTIDGAYRKRRIIVQNSDKDVARTIVDGYFTHFECTH